MKVLAFAASNSKNSINKQLVQYAGGQLTESGAQIEYLDLNDYEMPIYSVDREEESGIPQLAHDFFNKIGQSDAIVISYAEHNGNYTAAYKNIFDWASRIDMKVFQGKPMVLLATSPGAGGAASVLSIAKTSAPFFDGQVKADISLPSFYDNFDGEMNVITNEEIKLKLENALGKLLA